MCIRDRRHAALAVGRLLDHEAPPALVPTVQRALELLGAPAGEDPELGPWAARQHPLLADMLPAMTRMTVTPTGLQTYEPANVIPPYADVVCDCRAVPGQGLEQIHEHVERALGPDLSFELELLEPLEGGTESPVDTPLFGLIEDYVAERLPGAAVVPVICAGFNDSYWVRGAFDTVAYGFAPIFATDPLAYHASMHAADESLAIADLTEIAEFHLHALRSLCT